MEKEANQSNINNVEQPKGINAYINEKI